MVNYYKSLKKRNRYDEFLHKIQQQKMKELWDNKEDEEWENALNLRLKIHEEI